MTADPLDAATEIEKIARNLLQGAHAWGKFPTPVDSLMAYGELSLARGIDLSEVQSSFFSLSRNFFGRVSRKVL
jgi:hypothetical protein